MNLASRPWESEVVCDVVGNHRGLENHGLKTPVKIKMGNGKPPSLIGDMGVSKNRGTPKWMVYNGKPY